MSVGAGVDGARELPAGWVWATLGDLLLRIEAGKSFTCEPRRAELDEWGVIKVSAMTWGEFDAGENKAVPAGREIDPGYEIHSGDLLVSRANTKAYVGAPVLVGACRPKLLLSDKSLRLVPNSGVSKRWLVHFLRSPEARSYVEAKASGTKDAMRNLSQEALRGMPVPLPPFVEQHRIVEALEEQLSRLDKAEDVARQVSRRKPQLVGAFRDTIIHAVGDLPAGWRWGELADVIERVEAGKSFRCDPRPAQDEEWGVVKVSAMTWGEFRQEEQKAVPAGREVDARYEIKAGDILVSRANTPEYVGAPVLVRQTRPRLLLSDKSLRLVPKPGVKRDWLITVLSAPLVRKQITAKATGIKDSMRNISQKDLLAVKVPVPPTDEQQSLAERADEMLTAVDGAARDVERVVQRAGALRRAILRRAFSGQLVAQNPADEDASAALVRIMAARAAQPKTKRTRTKPPAPRAEAAPHRAPEPTPAPALAVQQEFDL